MKIPLTWLREYVPAHLPVDELARRLTIAGLEVGGVRSYGLPLPAGLTVKPEEAGPVWARDKVVTARVVAVEKHPNADKLKLVRLDYGAPLADLWGDVVLEVDVLPNMARCLAMLGVAREVAALTGTTATPPALDFPAEGPPVEGRVTVSIADPKMSARYAAVLIEGVTI